MSDEYFTVVFMIKDKSDIELVGATKGVSLR